MRSDRTNRVFSKKRVFRGGINSEACWQQSANNTCNSHKPRLSLAVSGKNSVAKKLDISGSLKVKINKSNNKNEAGYLIRARQSASMGLRSCYRLKQFRLKYIR
jgi:hypothetical protein